MKLDQFLKIIGLDDQELIEETILEEFNTIIKTCEEKHPSEMGYFPNNRSLEISKLNIDLKHAKESNRIEVIYGWGGNKYDRYPQTFINNLPREIADKMQRIIAKHYKYLIKSQKEALKDVGIEYTEIDYKWIDS